MKSKLNVNAGMPDGTRFAIPLTVGIVGHRDCADRVQLEVAIRDFLGELRDTYTDTSIQILTSLAEGADRLAAKVALEMHFDVIGLLPMSREVYERDFDEESRRELDQLLSRTREWFELPRLASVSLEDIAQAGPARNRQYAQAGAFIVRHSQIFLALWDGTPSDAEGGTAATVRFRRFGVPPPYAPLQSPLDMPDTGPVYQIVTRRESNPGGASQAAGRPGTLRVLLPASAEVRSNTGGHDLAYYAQLCASINAFNRAVARLLANNNPTIRLGVDDLVRVAGDTHDGSGTDPPILAASSGLWRIAAAYGAADTLALSYQRRSARMTRLFFALGACMVLSFAVYSYRQIWPALALYLVLFASMAAMFRFGRIRENYDFSLDARALAEALRVQFFWRMAGSWEGVAHHYLRKQAEELRWIREALRSLDIAPPFLGRLTDHLAWARRWILDQSQYLDDSVTARARRLRRLIKSAYRLYGGGLAVSLLVVVASARGIPAPLSPLLAKAVMLMGLAPAFAALWTGYAEFMSFEEDISRHARMKTIFERARIAVQALAADLKEAAAVSDRQPSGSRDEEVAAQRLRDLLHDLGSEALRENADWLLLHRGHRPKPQMT